MVQVSSNLGAYNCWRLRKEIDKLIQEGKLRVYVKGERGEDQRRSSEEKNEENHKKESKERHTLNTISGGFAGGGESNSSRKKYVRQVMFINDQYDTNPNTIVVLFASTMIDNK